MKSVYTDSIIHVFFARINLYKIAAAIDDGLNIPLDRLTNGRLLPRTQ